VCSDSGSSSVSPSSTRISGTSWPFDREPLGCESFGRVEKCELGTGRFFDLNRLVRADPDDGPSSSFAAASESCSSGDVGSDISGITPGRVDSTEFLPWSESLKVALCRRPPNSDSGLESDENMMPSRPLGDSPRAHDASSCVCSLTP